MADFTIYLGNKNYSSWSLRGWLMLKASGLDFDEVLIPLDTPGTKAEILRHSPSGPGAGAAAWRPDHLGRSRDRPNTWPKSGAGAAAVAGDPVARALARSISAEMHSRLRAAARTIAR
jgi:glutathione S-transferase